MAAAVKIAVTVPADLYAAVEAARRHPARTRSKVVQEALRAWLRQRAPGRVVREYETGYRRSPEGEKEIDAAMATAVGVLRDQNDW